MSAPPRCGASCAASLPRTAPPWSTARRSSPSSDASRGLLSHRRSSRRPLQGPPTGYDGHPLSASGRRSRHTGQCFRLRLRVSTLSTMARLMAGAWDRPVVTTTRRGEAGFRAVGVLLLVIPFLPVAAMFGPHADPRGLFGPVDWVLGTGIFLTRPWLARMLAPPQLLRALRRRGRALASWLRPAALPLVLAA